MLAVKVIDVGVEFGRFDGGCDWEEEFVAGMSGGVAGCGNLVAVEGGFGCCGGDEVAHGELVEGGKVGVDLLPAAPGKQRDPGLGGVEVVLGGVGLSWERGRGGLGGEERMADELGVDAALAVEGLLEWKDDEHLGDALLDPAKTVALPGPELWRDEPYDGDAGAAQVASEAEVHVGEVDEDGDAGAIAADGANETAVARIDVGDVAEDLGDAHDGDVLGAHDLLLVLAGHLGAAEAGEGCAWEAGAECGDHLGSVGVAGGFASRKEDARIGDSSDGSSSSSFVAGDEVVMPLTWSARWVRV